VFRALAVAASFLAFVPAARAEDAPALQPRHQAFLDLNEPLLTDEERAVFDALGRDFQRDLFIDAFWKARDPFPETAANELRNGWEARLEEVRQRFDDLRDDRARMFVWNGAAAKEMKPACRSEVRPIEIWRYNGSAAVGARFAVAFVPGTRGEKGPWRVWRPREGLDSLRVFPRLDEDPAQAIAENCTRGEDMLDGLSMAVDWETLRSQLAPFLRPNPEWLRAFQGRSTDLPAGAAELPATLELRFPGRVQSRTVVEALILVPREALPAESTSTFLIDGTVLREGEIFESFRYRFETPLAAQTTVPLVVQRYLRPGAYHLILRAEETASHRFFRSESDLEVPQITQPPPAIATQPPAQPPAAPLDARSALSSLDRAIATGDQTVKLFAPFGELVTGRVRLEARTTGEGIARVAFSLDGRAMLTKSRPPWSVELDLGRAPRTHAVRAAALDAPGAELAADEVLLNAGPHRFRIRLREPRPDLPYVNALRAEADVEVPDGDAIDRVEFFLGEQRLAALYQPPFVLPVLLPRPSELTYVRAIAYLRDGNSAEDVVFVNAPGYAEQMQVDLVELYATVTDRRGQVIEGLERGDFTAYENGERQDIVRFERVRDLPIHAGVLLDTSASMLEELPDAERGALRFFSQVIEAKDRAAVLTFADQPRLVVPFTNDPAKLQGGVASLVADGETALWDSVVYALHYFSGLRGKRAVVLLTDGEDSKSKWTFEETIDFARRAGVAVYAIGLDLPQRAVEAHNKLERLAAETGGRAFFIARSSELERVYGLVEAELRSQYLITYQSPATDPNRFREVDLRVARPGAVVKTIKGYFP
jgi:Ca-activated chloride channel family protein